MYDKSHCNKSGLSKDLFSSTLQCVEMIVKTYQKIHPSCVIFNNKPFITNLMYPNQLEFIFYVKVTQKYSFLRTHLISELNLVM